MAAAAPATAATVPAAKVIAQTTWGTTSPESVTADAAAPGGGFYATGTTNLTDSLGDPLDLDEIFLIKVAANGSLVWQQNYAASKVGIYNANDMAVAPDGSIYVTGLFAPDGDQAGDILLLKFAPDGSLLWQRTWDNNGNSEDGESVAVASDGSVYVTGGSDPVEAVGPLVLLRYSPDGNLVWQKTWTDTVPGTTGASGDAVAVGPDGKIRRGDPGRRRAERDGAGREAGVGGDRQHPAAVSRHPALLGLPG
jgi:outer membrane protein assembly factor BamB